MLEFHFKRKFSRSMYKDLKLNMAQMSFYKDFVNNDKGDLYPVVEKSENLSEQVKNNEYFVEKGNVKRLFCSFFPYATYEMSFETCKNGTGFVFTLPNVCAKIVVSDKGVAFEVNERKQFKEFSEICKNEQTLIVSCRPKAFDLFFENNGRAELFCTFKADEFSESHKYFNFSKGNVLVEANEGSLVKKVSSYIDNGISVADLRPVKYENGDVIFEDGKVYLTATIRMVEEMFQGVFSWIPSTNEFSLCGALFYDAGDGYWCGDVAASLKYHRKDKMWYLWVCSFSHGHILAHSKFDGEPRFGVNVIDVTLMEKAENAGDKTQFCGFWGDEDTEFIYDDHTGMWTMAICRLFENPKRFGYVFFESDDAFSNYSYIGKGIDGCETGGSFVKVEGEKYFVCGNDYDKKSDYRVYSKNGMVNAGFDYPDGGFRGWGSIIPVKAAGRTRYYWITFDRHNASEYNWSYGNLYCFEAVSE